MLELQIVRADVQHVAAEALLVPVDGALCRLGGAAASALRAALAPDERDDEIEYISEMLASSIRSAMARRARSMASDAGRG